jgi:hypothetical protein
MRTFFRASVIAFALLPPRLAAASELQLELIEPFVDFGPAGASLGSEFGFRDLFLDGVYLETPWFSNFSGDVSIETGPASLIVDDSDPNVTQSHYDFDPGIFTLTVHWTDQFGTAMQGQYVAPVLDLLIDVTCEQELSMQDCGDIYGESHGPMSAFMGPGMFDPNLAAILRLQRPGGAFDFFDLFLDGITGDPSDRLRLAGSAGGQLDLAIPVEVPEPSILALLLFVPVVRRRLRR